jgi:curved DNA-binding protein
MDYKDYYKDLGLERTSTPAEIKKAYRTLVKKHHPDKNNGDKASEERFKVISEANEVLSDPEKRKKYDQLGADWKHYEEAGAQPNGFDWSKYANARANQTNQTNSYSSNTGFSDESVNDFFEMLFGQHESRQRGRRRAATSGADYEIETTISLEEVFHGTTRLININEQTIRVTIKPGITDLQKLRIPGKGGLGINGGANGNLYLTVKVAPHAEFHRKGNDIQYTLPVGLYTAVLGGKTQVHTLKGKVTANIPKGTPNGKILRLRGLGLPVYEKKDEFGNLYVKIDIKLPELLIAEEIELFKKLAALRNPVPEPAI